MIPQRGRRTNQERGREISEFDQRVLDLRRTARVVAGGRRFSFRAVVVVGNRKGLVGIGMGKGQDVSQAVEKAT
ncbi:MAG: small subunit ribosomal protein S5, partial [Parcubacteria group bacterium Gr01-1014_66]